MKKILYIALVGILALSTSCDFDLSPSTSLPTKEAITSVDDLQMAVNGVYQMMSLDRGGHASDYGLYADCKGGDVRWINTSGHIVPLMDYSVTENDGLAINIYFAINEPIAFANMAMEGAVALGMETPGVAELYAELRAARAMLHFDAARLYSRMPTQNGVVMTAENSGVVKIDKVYPPATKFKRSTLQETYDYIIKELEEAIPTMTTDKKLGGMNAWAAKLILARAYLYTGQNDKAYTTAVDVISNSPYDLFTYSNYVDAWRAEGSDEFIFEIRTSDNTANSPQRNSLGYYTNPTGYAEVGVNDNAAFTNNVKGAFDALDDNDIRKQSISLRSNAGANEGYYTIKYMGRDGTTIYSSNPRPARLAEAYLIASEAAVKGGSTQANADKYYNDLRRERYAPGTYTDAANVTLDDILDERRVELFCENHRLFDLVRNNKPVVRYDAAETYQPDNDLLVHPFPLRETDVNPDLKQNPGY